MLIYDIQNVPALGKNYLYEKEENLQKVAEKETEQIRRELQILVFLCQAWEKMMIAEAKASSAMYGKAARLFEQAKEYVLDKAIRAMSSSK